MAFINGKDHFKVKLYTGNGSASNAITGLGFQPDFVWMKARAFAESHILYDSVRGTTKRLVTNATEVEETRTNGLSAFGADGFTLNADNGENKNAETFLSWNWKAGTTSGITQGGASITPTSYSFNAAAGFSMIKYTGTGSAATVPHGLGKAPKMIIIKCTSHTSNWAVYHKSIGATKMLNLNQNTTEATNSGYFNNTDPTSSVFSLGDEGNDTNGSGKTYLAYCWSEIPGYSAFGMYKGQGNADGPAVKTGFKPAWVLVRNASATNNWFIQDIERIGRNPNNHLSKPNNNGADDTGNHIDILSNGFKVRGVDDDINAAGPGDDYIYIAIAAEPLVGDSPATAN